MNIKVEYQRWISNLNIKDEYQRWMSKMNIKNERVKIILISLEWIEGGGGGGECKVRITLYNCGLLKHNRDSIV